MREVVASSAVGVGFGFALSRIGFSQWDEVHRMFLFKDLRLTLAFGAAVVLLAAAWPLLRRLSRVPPAWPARPVHPGTLAGGLVFGAGWALSGACPSIALVQLGEGQLAAVYTLAGIFMGNVLYAKVHERWFRWSPGSCMDD